MKKFSEMTWDDHLRDIHIAELGALMSACSERCRGAAWHSALEEVLPQYAQRAHENREPIPFGRDVVRVKEAEAMLELVGLIGEWVTLGEETPLGYATYVVIPLDGQG